MTRLQVADIQLHVVQEGTGHPLLLVHGFPLDHSMWNRQLEELQQTYRVIAPDLRGFGQSDVTPGVVTMQRMADDLAFLLELLEVRDPVTLCGLSMGGYVAFQFWQRHPMLISELILCDTRAAADSPEAARQRTVSAERVLREGTGFLAESMLEKLLAPGSPPQLLDSVRRLIRSAQPEAVAAALRGMAQREDFTDRLSRIDLPTLVVCGEHDAITSVEEMSAMASTLRLSQLEVVRGAGHLAPLEQPAAVNEAIRRFLAEQGHE